MTLITKFLLKKQRMPNLLALKTTLTEPREKSPLLRMGGDEGVAWRRVSRGR